MQREGTRELCLGGIAHHGWQRRGPTIEASDGLTVTRGREGLRAERRAASGAEPMMASGSRRD